MNNYIKDRFCFTSIDSSRAIVCHVGYQYIRKKCLEFFILLALGSYSFHG